MYAFSFMAIVVILFFGLYGFLRGYRCGYAVVVLAWCTFLLIIWSLVELRFSEKGLK